MTTQIPVLEKIHSANDRIAAANRAALDAAGVFALNFMASPGAGKTSLVEQTVTRLAENVRVGMINGDIATSLDAERAQLAGATAVQINIHPNPCSIQNIQQLRKGLLVPPTAERSHQVIVCVDNGEAGCEDGSGFDQ